MMLERLRRRSRGGPQRPIALAWIAASVVASMGCGEPLPISIASLRDDPDDAALVDKAAAILGIEWEASRRSRGTVQLALIDVGDLQAGDSGGVAFLRKPRCYKAALAIRAAPAVAHEIAHLLGLDHVCEAPCPPELRTNLMNGEKAGGTDLTAEQLDDVDKGRRRLTGCR